MQTAHGSIANYYFAKLYITIKRQHQQSWFTASLAAWNPSVLHHHHHHCCCCSLLPSSTTIAASVTAHHHSSVTPFKRSASLLNERCKGAAVWQAGPNILYVSLSYLLPAQYLALTGASYSCNEHKKYIGLWPPEACEGTSYRQPGQAHLAQARAQAHNAVAHSMHSSVGLTTNGTKSSGKPSPLPGTHWYIPPGRCERLHSSLRFQASHSGMLAQLQDKTQVNNVGAGQRACKKRAGNNNC